MRDESQIDECRKSMRSGRDEVNNSYTLQHSSEVLSYATAACCASDRAFERLVPLVRCAIRYHYELCRELVTSLLSAVA